MTKYRHHRKEQIIRMLRQADEWLMQDVSTEDICKRLNIGISTYHRWRKLYEQNPQDQAWRLSELEKENTRLKRMIAEQAMDIAILKETLEGKY
jgi:hypothetical protein